MKKSYISYVVLILFSVSCCGAEKQDGDQIKKDKNEILRRNSREIVTVSGAVYSPHGTSGDWIDNNGTLYRVYKPCNGKETLVEKWTEDDGDLDDFE